MGCCWPEEVCNRLSKELVKGQEWAIQLKNLLQRAPQQLGDEDDGSVVPTTVDLAVKIFTSFTESLSVLNANSNSNSNSNSAHPDESTGGDGVCHQNEIMKTEPSHLDHSYCDERSLEDSGESKKKSSSVIRDRRGCYKRRKASHSWKIITAVIDDGQAWRKYGQKNILNSLYPRSYFRCTRKFDENCKANKQVQQIQDNPRMYETTYIGQHTCSNVLIKSTLPQVILKDSDQDWKSNSNHMIFTTPGQTRIVNYKADTTKHLMTSSSRQSVIKKDMSITKEEGSTPNDHLSDNLSSMDDDNNNNNNNYISWSDLEAFDLSEPTIFKSFPKMVSENEDVVNFYDVLMSRDDW